MIDPEIVELLILRKFVMRCPPGTTHPTSKMTLPIFHFRHNVADDASTDFEEVEYF
jgi:hypothetical protein